MLRTSIITFIFQRQGQREKSLISVQMSLLHGTLPTREIPSHKWSQRSENERCSAFVINIRVTLIFVKEFWSFLLLAIVPLLGITLVHTVSRTETKTTDFCITANIFCP